MKKIKANKNLDLVWADIYFAGWCYKKHTKALDENYRITNSSPGF